jgi:hypothetical protein
MRKGVLAVLLAAALGGCVARPTPVDTAARLPAEVEVVRDGDRWTAEYRFDREAPAWVLARSPLARVSGKPWRPESWTVDTPGVRLERHGWYDVLVADNGPVPATVRVRFTPFAKDIETDYDPALVFTDGSVALFDQQFKIFPAASVEEVAKLPIDYSTVPATAAATRVTFRDSSGRVLHGGKRQSSVTLDDAGTYVLFGPARPISTKAMSTIIDPQLPEWLRSFLSRSTPEVLARFAETLGDPPPGPAPTVMVSWNGPSRGLTSMGGSVLPGLVVMTFEGEGVLAENQEMRNQARWFIAHESAHFWLGQAVAYEFARDAWIMEGGADLLAIRAVAALDPAYDARAALQRAVDECVSLTAGRGVASAHERSEPRAHYACGAVFGHAAEAVSGTSFADYVRPLIDANRADKVLTRGEWLAALEAAGGGAVTGKITALLDTGAADPKVAMASLLAAAGVPHTIAADGRPLLK